MLVDNKSPACRPEEEVRLGPVFTGVAFSFGPATNSGWAPLRVRNRLEAVAKHQAEGE